MAFLNKQDCLDKAAQLLAEAGRKHSTQSWNTVHSLNQQAFAYIALAHELSSGVYLTRVNDGSGPQDV